MFRNIQLQSPHDMVMGQTGFFGFGFGTEDTNKLRGDNTRIIEHNEYVLHLPCPL